MTPRLPGPGEPRVSGEDIPPSSGVARFRRTAERVLDVLLELSPDHATELGEHRYDDRLPDFSPSGTEQRIRCLHQAAGALDDLDDGVLDPPDRVDLEILRTEVTRDLWVFEELAPHERDPLLHLPGDALYPLLVRAPADPAERLAVLTARLAAVPGHLRTAQDVLHDMPRVHVETAIGRAHGIAAMLGDEVEALATADDGAAPPLRAARDAAVSALRDHAAWLEARLPDSDGDPRLGPERYAATLWYTLDSEIGPDALLTRAESDLQAVEEEIAALASRIAGSPPRPGQVREVLDRLAAEAPVDGTTILPLCERLLATATARVRELDLVTVPGEPVRVVVMPESRRGEAVAYCDPPGPLEPRGPEGPEPAFFAVSPPPSGWAPQRVASFYREYNRHLLSDLVVHEAMPGHVLQLAHAAAYRGPTRVRTAVRSGSFVEGWAVYAEALMAACAKDADGSLATGNGRVPPAQAQRMVQLKMQLRSTINAILDVRVHAHGMTETEALHLMTERGHQEEGEAIGKWRRALLTSAQLATYYVGYHEVRDVVRALRRERPGATPRAVHDAVLAHGSPPPRHLRTLLGLAPGPG
ncbi:MAG: hypothetical protein QG622_541 [Actinomycetota bacterium]|nr:hypothetical protein [Actinomycetota bacterium]